MGGHSYHHHVFRTISRNYASAVIIISHIYQYPRDESIHAAHVHWRYLSIWEVGKGWTLNSLIWGAHYLFYSFPEWLSLFLLQNGLWDFRGDWDGLVGFLCNFLGIYGNEDGFI